MKAIIYSDEAAAINALNICTANISPGEIRKQGEGPFATPEPGKPYTTIIKHPVNDLWALVADEKVESLLGFSAVELDSSWFPTSVLDL